MKAKSFSKRKLNKQEKNIVNLATSYLIDWTKKELGKYINEPVVIQVGDHGFLVGNFKITGQARNCWEVYKNNDEYVHTFINKPNAIIYCLCEVTKRYDPAKELLELDAKIGKLEIDMLQYQHIIDNSKDKFKSQLVLNRYLDARFRYKTANDILKKTLKSAKYSKFGNQTL